MDALFQNQALIATLIGFFSAAIDNVPLVAATMGMYPLEIRPDGCASPLAYESLCSGDGWKLMLIIGSAAGVCSDGYGKNPISFST